MKTKPAKPANSANGSWFSGLSHTFVQFLALSSVFGGVSRIGTYAQSPAPANVIHLDALLPNQATLFTGKGYTAAEMASFSQHHSSASGSLVLAVASVGDVTNDTRDDFVLTETVLAVINNVTQGVATAYIIRGAPSYSSSIDLTNLSPSVGTMAIKHNFTSYFPFLAVPEAGDINGDGLADLVFDAGAVNDATDRPTSANLIYWHAGNHSMPNLIDLEQDLQTTTIKTIASGIISLIPTNVVAVGDMDKNGQGDLLQGGVPGAKLLYSRYLPNQANQSYVVNTDNSLTPPQGELFLVNGTTGSSSPSVGVAPLHDFNGDGFPDFMTRGVQVNVVFGKKSFSSSVNLDNIAIGDGFSIYSGTSSNPTPAGEFISSAGDFNGDGLADAMNCGVALNPLTSTAQGRAVVLFGTNTSSPIYMDAMSQTQGMIIWVDPITDFAKGRPLLNCGKLGDVNNDGFGDIYILAYLNNFNTKLFIVFGNNAPRALNLSALTSAQGVILLNSPPQPSNGIITYVASAGDPDSNGYDDVLISQSTIISKTQNTSTGSIVYLLKGEVLTALASGNSVASTIVSASMTATASAGSNPTVTGLSAGNTATPSSTLLTATGSINSPVSSGESLVVTTSKVSATGTSSSENTTGSSKNSGHTLESHTALVSSVAFALACFFHDARKNQNKQTRTYTTAPVPRLVQTARPAELALEPTPTPTPTPTPMAPQPALQHQPDSMKMKLQPKPQRVNPDVVKAAVKLGAFRLPVPTPVRRLGAPLDPASTKANRFDTMKRAF